MRRKATFNIVSTSEGNILNTKMTPRSKRNWHIWRWQKLTTSTLTTTTGLLLLILLLVQSTDCHHDAISQISPKSSNKLPVANFKDSQTARLTIESTMADIKTLELARTEHIVKYEENETRAEHSRIKRSASPVLNDIFPKSGPNDVHFPGENEKEFVGAGRYFHYNIKPTGTYQALSEEEEPERTQRLRTGKTLATHSSEVGVQSSSDAQSFLVKGDLRPFTSGSPINPTISTATSMAASATVTPSTVTHNGRQNGNPDIQDIITGIVKLLNGNVNVHANTQGVRRPSASRINNRGPPRISDVQTLPIDYEAQKPGTSIRPPPYPFDRPERPFITGVPIPEQIVPVRPGFVSNRPPWYRNKPRPPITTSVGSRRPIPQYKPVVPAQQIVAPEETAKDELIKHKEQDQLTPPVAFVPADETSADYNATLEAARPTDTTYDSEFSNEDTNTQYIEVSDQDIGANAPMNSELEVDDEEQHSHPSTTTQTPTKKHELSSSSKKKPQKSNGDKKKSTTEYSTIIETSSVVHTVIGSMSSAYVPMSMDTEELELDPSTEEVIFMTANRTPALDTTKSSTPSLLSQTSYSSITTTPLSILKQNTIEPTTSISYVETIKSSITTTTSTTITKNSTTEKASNTKPTNDIAPTLTPQPAQYQPRPGIVLDDPEFKPGGRPRPQRPSVQQQAPTHIQPTRQHLPPGYGEIFDVTLSAIQGPGSIGGSSQQTINIKPYGSYGTNKGGSNGGGNGVQGDIIVSAAGDEGFVSIDGKRTYINLFGDPTDPPTGTQLPTSEATLMPHLPNGSGTNNGESGSHGNKGAVTQSSNGYAVPETEIVDLQPTKPHSGRPPQQQSAATNTGPTRPQYRTRPTQPPVRIDTCIVGDDSTCDQAQHEHCKTENGVSSCHCRPGYSRRKHREPCRKVISFHLGMRVDRIYEHRIVWDNKLQDRNSEPYGQLTYESIRAIDSAMSMTPYSDEFMDAKVNNIYRGDPNLGGSGVFVNLTIKLDESVETLRPNLRSDVQKHLIGVLQRRNNNIGSSVLYVSSPEGAISALHDLDECQSIELNDCHASAVCTNTWGSFRCSCDTGLRDPWGDQPQRAGRECQSCPDSYCNNRGTCSYNEDGNQACVCDSSHYGAQCEIDGEVLGVAIGASVAAVIIIVLTLVCLIMWSRRWQREQKNAMGSPVFGYMNTAPLKSVGLPQAAGYQVTLEDRMRWAQIADVMAQTNHYGAEPIGPTRPSSALFAAYPNLQAMGTLGGMSMQSAMQMHQNATLAPPVPLPRRLGLGGRSNGMRTLENSSSSEEEDRADLLGRNFQVPRPKSRSNGSIANQSGIYYDVDYEPSGNGIGNTSIDHLYNTHNQSVTSNIHIPGPQGIPMSTYTSGRAPSSYYMK